MLGGGGGGPTDGWTTRIGRRSDGSLSRYQASHVHSSATTITEHTSGTTLLLSIDRDRPTVQISLLHWLF